MIQKRFYYCQPFLQRLVAPLNGQSVVLALKASGGPGVFDRLLADGYSHAGLETLTLDRQMVSLPSVRRL